MPILAVVPALGVVAYLSFAGEPLPAVVDGSAVEGSASESPVDAPRERRAAIEIDPDTLMSTIGDRRALPDTIGVLLERRLPGASTVEEYLTWLPPGLEKGDRRWPVILYLHGRSLRGEDPSRLLRYGLPRYLAEGRSIPFIVVAPQQRPPGGWRDPGRLDDLLDAVEARYPVDRDRIYLTGYSMGGGGVWRMAEAHADRFAAAVPLAAPTPAPTPARVHALAGLPTLVYHGAADDVALPGPAIEMVEALEDAGAEVELRLIEGADHGDLTTIYRDPQLYAWMLEHER